VRRRSEPGTLEFAQENGKNHTLSSVPPSIFNVLSLLEISEVSEAMSKERSYRGCPWKKRRTIRRLSASQRLVPHLPERLGIQMGRSALVLLCYRCSLLGYDGGQYYKVGPVLDHGLH